MPIMDLVSILFRKKYCSSRSNYSVPYGYLESKRVVACRCEVENSIFFQEWL